MNAVVGLQGCHWRQPGLQELKGSFKSAMNPETIGFNFSKTAQADLGILLMAIPNGRLITLVLSIEAIGDKVEVRLLAYFEVESSGK